MLEAYDAEHVYSSTTAYSTRAFTNFASEAERQGSAIAVPAPGDAFSLGSAAVTILGPLRDYGNNNENSIVLRIDYGETSFLFTGDMGREAEDELVDSGAELSATVLKVGHHGSNSSTSSSFLKSVSPKIAVISVGADNSYGHPTQAILQRLSDSKITVYRTDLCGTVTVIGDGTSYTVETERTPAQSPSENPTVAAPDTPQTEKPTVKDEGSAIVYITKTGSKYHRDGCSYLKSKIQSTVADAKAKGQ